MTKNGTLKRKLSVIVFDDNSQFEKIYCDFVR